MSKPVVMLDVSHVFRSPAADVVAVDGVKLRLKAGEFTVLHGVSGSGKSTLINILAGLLHPTSGTVHAFGIDLTNASRDELARYRREKASVVFQEFNLLSMLRIAENVALPLELNGMDSRSARAKAIEALARVGLVDIAERFPGELSGGQRQRVAIARALVANKTLLLADEPTGSLDRQTAEMVIGGLCAARDAGSTVVVATHDMTIAEHADQVLTMVDGRLPALQH